MTDTTTTTVIDFAKVGTKGYPKHPTAIGLQPPTKVVDAQSASTTSPPALSLAEQVERERDRRLAAGFDYDFGTAGGVQHIGTTPADLVGWDDVSKYAAALLAAGDTATKITIATNDGTALVTASEWQHVLLAAAAFRQPIWQASFVIEAMSPIPAGLTDDKHWGA